MKERDRPTLEQYALLLASEAALRSQDPENRVGAVIMYADGAIASTGYNGGPAGFDVDWTSEPEIRLSVIHAEANALRYVVPHEARGGLLATTRRPCVECVKQIASYSIRRVLYVEEAGASHDSSLAAALLLGVRLEKVDPYEGWDPR